MKNTVKTRLKFVRKTLKMSQKNFSEFLELNFRTYQNWEQGHRQIDLENLVKIADKLNLSIDWLLGRDKIVVLYNLDMEKILKINSDMVKKRKT